MSEPRPKIPMIAKEARARGEPMPPNPLAWTPGFFGDPILDSDEHRSEYVFVSAAMLARVLSESTAEAFGPITPEFWQKQGQALFDALVALKREPPQ